MRLVNIIAYVSQCMIQRRLQLDALLIAMWAPAFQTWVSNRNQTGDTQTLINFLFVTHIQVNKSPHSLPIIILL